MLLAILTAALMFGVFSHALIVLRRDFDTKAASFIVICGL